MQQELHQEDKLFKKKELEKEYVIPIFVPHLGCPQACTFCNQVRISGQETTVTAKAHAEPNHSEP